MNKIRLIDREGVTWQSSVAVESLPPVYFMAVSPRVSANFLWEGQTPIALDFRTATFRRTHIVTGDGHVIYRMVEI